MSTLSQLANDWAAAVSNAAMEWRCIPTKEPTPSATVPGSQVTIQPTTPPCVGARSVTFSGAYPAADNRPYRMYHFEYDGYGCSYTVLARTTEEAKEKLKRWAAKRDEYDKRSVNDAVAENGYIIRVYTGQQDDVIETERS